MATKSAKPVTVKTLIARATAALESPREAALVTGLALRKARAWLFAHEDAPIEDAVAGHFDALLKKRVEGHPFAYLSGTREFYGREFRVNPAVLIPRPETEHVVEWALTLHLPPAARVADIGTGSGCIILTLAAERPAWQCCGTDISDAALTVAADNRERFGLNTVELRHGDLLSPASGKMFDLIVSNPPYVAGDDPHLLRGDLRFEPEVALSDGADGLAMIRALIEGSCDRLVPGGWLLLEHGHDQAAAVRELFRGNGYENIESHRDLAGIERVTGGQIRIC